MPEPVVLDSCELKLVDPERVRAVQTSLPEPDVVEELAEVFGLLSDPSRLRLLASLLEGGELCVCDLAAAAGMAESTTSHALRLLRAHHVVKARRAGRMMHYSLRDGHVRMLLDVALEHVRHAEPAGPGPVPVP
ncbi:MAG: metalloregulator ArsR/SmtB family transcription factor [Actinomycetota bacterium]|nr:metalloregulator ArsR/SmtB family transcription factor [Actinomycetota bacterium]